MAKSMVERYEQLLRQDPTSSVFVELAKALLEKGDAARTIEVCEQGIAHHPSSTVGRVLWGKALIQLGRPAEAMEQFDRAIAIEKDNPYAYNLIGEVLLQRGLYRSALPILRKAVALQPNDGRVKVWLEQAQQALAGGPAPVFANLMGLESPAEPEADVGAKPDDDATAVHPTVAPRAAARLRAAALGDVEKAANTPAAGTRVPTARAAADLASAAGQGSVTPPVAPQEEPSAQPVVRDSLGLIDRSVPESSLGSQLPSLDLSLSDEDDSPPAEGDAAARAGEQEAGADGAAGREASGAADVDLSSEEREAGGRDAAGGQEPASAEEELLRSSEFTTAKPVVPAAAEPSEEELLLLRSSEFTTAKPVIPAASSGGLLGDLPPPEPTAKAAVVARAPQPARGAGSKRSLLDDIPDAAEASAAAAQAKAPKQDTEALTAAYEKELRQKLAREAAKTSFLKRNGVKVAGSVALALVLVVVVVGFLKVRANAGGQTLNEALGRAEDLITQDTRASLDGALEQLARARDMDDGSSRAWALTAWARALRFADHGMSPEDRQLALEALEKPGVKESAPGLALATNVLVADDRGREPARRALLAATEEGTEVQALAGSLYLAAKDEKKALEHFDRALRASPSNVRALVALGGYYLGAEDFPHAIEMFEKARTRSPSHPVARLGQAEARLALEQDLAAALADVEPLSKDPLLPASLKPRLDLTQGRLLSAAGRHDEARALLGKGAQGPLAFDFQLALAAASRAAGKLDAAQAAYEAALKSQPKSEEAREGLGRTLLDRDRERDVLTRLEADGGRKVAMVRGAAYARLGDWKKARAELARTRVNDRYPPEAVSLLALADAAEGNAVQARELLEKALLSSKRPRNDMRIALGQVYWRERALDKAQKQFQEAQKDPRDYEASCSLGRLLLSRGLPDMALEPLTQAVERNGSHGESRDALGRTLLALGRTPEALKQFEAWQLDNPGSAAAHKGFALALFHSGRRKDAEAAVGRAAKLAPDDAEAHRVRAAILFSSGDAKGGFAALERANKLDPKDPDTFCEIAHAFLRQGNVDNADAAFAAARREGPDATCGRVGELYTQLPGGGRPAARTLEDLAARAPTAWDKAFAQAAMARALLGAGGSALAEARTAADEAVRLAPFEGRSHLALGLVALKQRKEAEAKTALAKAVELEPTDGMAHLALADVLVRDSVELPRAVASYEAFLELAGDADEAGRVKKALPALKKKAARSP
ncbi:tetratricopeptide repeat protein [Myxococcus sp. K15C18031901]|uniref:tetratricopeptide repeat protein n=1 Tax=Myxococcus dinghuensis TaxID=2906761 RepID=UPI0020A7926D|nr:tetratricopeptide repeat protein [Myxococcus dinghuensis]MCP3104836.1 tetratricopeptide repeat protein [Myxococcus dinghuensis]